MSFILRFLRLFAANPIPGYRLKLPAWFQRSVTFWRDGFILSAHMASVFGEIFRIATWGNLMVAEWAL
jgi:hypothetical protein